MSVDAGEGHFVRGGENFSVKDLPGMYALTPHSADERAAVDALMQTDGVILQIIDAAALERSLHLTAALASLHRPMVLALNMADELARRGVRIDVHTLTQLTGLPAFPISARRGEGIDALLAGARHAPVPRGGFDPRAVAAASIATTQCESRDDRIDRIVLRPYVGLPLVLLSVAAALYLSFGGVGMTLKAGFDALLDACIRAPLAALCTHFAVEPHLASFLLDGVCAGVLGVLGFLPQVALLFLCLSVFEDSGLAARMAFLCDPLLSRLGLSGRAFFPLCVGFGCTVPAVMAARVASPRERWVLYFCLPFVCCPARVPVFALITAALFPAAGILPLLLLYGLGLAAALLAAAVLTRIGGQPSEAFVMELPPYRLPHPRTLLAAAWEKCRDFLFRAGTLIFLAASAVWLLENLGPHGFVSLPTDSFLYRVGSLCAAPLAPLGFRTAARFFCQGDHSLHLRRTGWGTADGRGGACPVHARLGSIFSGLLAAVYALRRHGCGAPPRMRRAADRCRRRLQPCRCLCCRMADLYRRKAACINETKAGCLWQPALFHREPLAKPLLMCYDYPSFSGIGV